jgi:hypothetical protein
VRLTALTLVMLSVLAGPASSAPAPDSTALSRLHAASSELNRFRIITGHSQFVVTSLRLDPDGVVVREPPRRPAVIVTADTDPGETKRVAWSEIERIEGMRSHTLRGAIVGAIVGGVVGFGAKEAFQNDLHDASDVAILAIPIGAALGGVLGAWVGGTTGWHRLRP